ncbi:MAG: hypothetical protein H5T49_02510 [Hadesarchaea archaeon]|nr:hypothetical protein [Hadesarchaea archaeon]
MNEKPVITKKAAERTVGGTALSSARRRMGISELRQLNRATAISRAALYGEPVLIIDNGDKGFKKAADNIVSALR